MTGTLSRDGATWTLTLAGVVDVGEAHSLLACAREAARGPNQGLVVRLGDVEALDTASVQILLALKNALSADGRSFRISEASRPVAEAWRVSGLSAFLG